MSLQRREYKVCDLPLSRVIAFSERYRFTKRKKRKEKKEKKIFGREYKVCDLPIARECVWIGDYGEWCGFRGDWWSAVVLRQGGGGMYCVGLLLTLWRVVSRVLKRLSRTPAAVLHFDTGHKAPYDRCH